MCSLIGHLPFLSLTSSLLNQHFPSPPKFTTSIGVCRWGNPDSVAAFTFNVLAPSGKVSHSRLFARAQSSHLFVPTTSAQWVADLGQGSCLGPGQGMPGWRKLCCFCRGRVYVLAPCPWGPGRTRVSRLASLLLLDKHAWYASDIWPTF